jgi:hypothetical protein
MQTGRNRSGAYMHSGIRVGPHVGALRQCSFAKIRRVTPTRIIEHRPEAHLRIRITQQVLTVTEFPPVLQLRPECSRAPRWQTSYHR